MAANDRLVSDVLDGRYEITDRIGRGGMATVYRAKDRRLQRIVAIKIMREDADDDPENARRFDSEARAVAKLSDAHIVSVFDQGTDQNRPYIVMEYVDGTNLKAVIIKQGYLPVSRALPMLDAIVSGLAVAHEAGIIHRDIKPENVLISRSGEAKVTDFGLARQSDVTAMTVADGVLGSLSYVSPERLRHQAPVDFRSDVYSVGIVAFEMLTGHKPFEGDPGSVVTQHLEQDVPAPSSLTGPGAIPAWLDQLVVACGRRNAMARPVDGRDLLNRLRLGIEARRNGTEDDPRLIAAMRAAPGYDGNDDIANDETAAMDASPSLPLVAHEDTPSLSWRPDDRIPTDSQPNFKARRVLASILTIAVVIALVLGGWWVTNGRYTTMPGVANLPSDEASTVMQQAGLTLLTSLDYSETVPAGSIVSTTPDSGTRVLRGSTVRAVVSQGQERFSVPKLAGLSLDEAQAALESNNLTAGKVTQQYSDSVPEGTVISASLNEGAQVKRGAAIDLVVSNGPQPIQVPDFTGKPATDAMDALTNLGLLPTQTYDTSDTVAEGYVIAQQPNSGSLTKGDTVMLTVSQGPPMVTIPTGLVGGSADDAKAALEQLGLKPVFVFVTLEMLRQNIVSAISPIPGSSVKKGSQVTLYIR